MKEKVLIHIVDKNMAEEERIDSELTTVGVLQGSEDAYSIVYTETDDEFKQYETTLEVKGEEKVVMTRKGAFNTQMVIEKDKRHNCHYSTPYGEIMMGIYTRKIKSQMHPDGGELNFCYTIDYNSGFVSTKEMQVTVTKPFTEQAFS